MSTALFFVSLRLTSLLSGCFGGWGPTGGCGYGPMGWGHMINYGYGFGGGFMWVILLILIGVVIFLFVQSGKTKGFGGFSHETPLDILKKRYAKGEISKEEYEKMKSDLQ